MLQLAQGIFGYLPEVALKHIARELRKPYSEVAGVVGFYSFFSTVPRGEHLVRVCLGTACYVRGGMQVLEAFKKELGIDVGETTEDREFSLEVARCFGACGLAPVITIDDDVHHRVKPKRDQRDPRPVRRRSRSAAEKERLTWPTRSRALTDLQGSGREGQGATSTCAPARKDTQGHRAHGHLRHRRRRARHRRRVHDRDGRRRA